MLLYRIILLNCTKNAKQTNKQTNKIMKKKSIKNEKRTEKKDVVVIPGTIVVPQIITPP